MADFTIALAKVRRFEGGYVNDPDDTGGETYAGVARASHPSWAGWKIIDRYKTTPHTAAQLTQLFDNNPELQKLIASFYRQHYWDTILGDRIEIQLVADNIMDFAVNSGVDRAIKYAQAVVGTTQDGQMGPMTVGAINKLGKTFITFYKMARINFLNQIVLKSPVKKKYFFGWVNRTLNA